MEPFSIQCESCQAKLKAAKASLIGQSLPCPKCGSLVLVPSPEIDQEAKADPEGLASPDNSLDGSFEDVDQLLSQHTEAASAKRPQRKQPNPTGRRPIEPLNPAEQAWDNPAVARTRRILALSAGALGAILLLGVGGYAWLNQRVTATDPVEKNATEQPPGLPGTETASTSPTDIEAADSPAKSDIPSVAAATKSAIVDDQPPPLPSIAPADAEPKSVATENNANTNSPIAPGPSQRPGITSPIAGRTSSLERAEPTTALPTSPPSPTSSSILKPVSAAKSSLGELSSLLEESGSSISAITDATAAVTTADSVGLPKYFFETPRSAPIDVQRQLSQPCVGLRYDGVPLIEIFRDITTICSVPITIDTMSLVDRANSDRLLPDVSANVGNTDFLDAIERTIAPLGWAAMVTETGVVVTHADAGKSSSSTIDLTGIAGLGDDGLDGVIDAMKAMIAPESWAANANEFYLRRNGLTLTVQHYPVVQQAVQSFVTKTAAGIALASGQAANPAKLRQGLATVLAATADHLQIPCNLPITSRSSLGNLLGRIRAKTGIDIIANWETLATLGWTSRTTVPGNVSEPTLAEMLRQLTRATKSTAIVLDAQTVELTSPADAVRRATVEFYLVDDLFEQRFTAERILQLVQEAIENAPTRAASTTIYEPSCRCIIIAAPQSTHRVVESVIGQLRQLR